MPRVYLSLRKTREILGLVEVVELKARLYSSRCLSIALSLIDRLLLI
jgi:hypothetical protein